MEKSIFNVFQAFNGDAMIEAYKSVERVKINYDHGVSGERLNSLKKIIRDGLEMDAAKIFGNLTIHYQNPTVKDYFKDDDIKSFVETVLEYFDKETEKYLK